jgi:vacuolar protein-sorting-associated protein 4
MENKFIPDAIEIVSKAIAADNEGEYEKALTLYRDALGRFTMGLKYEKNDARKKLIIERVEGYMKRAEELRDYINKQNELGTKGGKGGGATGTKNKGDGEEDEDAEKTKLRGALSGAIVTETPDVKWDDVAGLDLAKESLKEVRTERPQRNQYIDFCLTFRVVIQSWQLIFHNIIIIISLSSVLFRFTVLCIVWQRR